MTSPYYRGEGGENTRHRVTGGVSVPVATGRGEGSRFFSRHTDPTGLSNSCGLCGLVYQGNRGMLATPRFMHLVCGFPTHSDPPGFGII